MDFVKIIFWISLFLLLYSYVGYGLVLFCLVKLKEVFMRRLIFPQPALPSVALVVCAYNEEAIIEAKIQNTLRLNYPADKLRILFVTDGSSDKTPDLVSNHARIILLHKPERRGKAAAMNRAAAFVQEEILVFCDANSLLNRDCIEKLVRHYANPQVGGVAGEKRVHSPAHHSGAALKGEGLYWRYESFLKKMDARLFSVVGVAGELFSIRKTCYEPLREDIVLEDFVLSMRVCLRGFVIAYEPEAYATEPAPPSMHEEQKRKIRISAGAFQAMLLVKEGLNFFKYPLLSFQYISHRVLRWTVCLPALLLAFAANLVLAIWSGQVFYTYLLYLQTGFYLLGLMGWICSLKNIRIRGLFVPYYFLFMNAAVLIGFHRFVMGRQSVLWEKSKRVLLGEDL